VRQQPLLERDDINDRKLQALRSMERHHRHLVALGLPVIRFVYQPGVFEIFFEVTAARVGLVELARVSE
jgi:hypothetical protein